MKIGIMKKRLKKEFKKIGNLYVQCIEMNLLDLLNLRVRNLFMMHLSMVVKHNTMMVNITKS